ncbi:hypothetical protein SK128_016368 [Halocaridina rubra]|uniref:Uncharacterized protein n=1 Tax=Halocaridina rubra TaxID=373956 RepID=A0AAN8ZTH5_HALRR
MFSFVGVLYKGLEKLKAKCETIACTAEEVHDLANSWLVLRSVLNTHNEVFSYLLHIRLDLFLGQAMAFLFTLATIRHSGSPLQVLLASIIPLGEITIRLCAICWAGDGIIAKYNEILDMLREYLCSSQAITWKGNCTGVSEVDFVGLHRLLSRMEAKPMFIQVWGSDKLCINTFVKQMGLVVTYLVVLLQLGPQEKQEE